MAVVAVAAVAAVAANDEFSGNADVSVDERGRLALPVLFREQARAMSAGKEDGKLWVTRDPYEAGCLSAYAPPEWARAKREAGLLDQTRLEVRKFQRYFIGNAFGVALDGSDRLLVPKTLRDAVGLRHKAKVVGVGNRMQIWPAGDAADAAINTPPSMDGIGFRP